MDTSDLIIISNIIAKKGKEKYLKVLSPRGETFYVLYTAKTKFNLEGVPVIYVNSSSPKLVKIPKSIREGGFQCVSDRVHGVIFEIEAGIFAIKRDFNMNVLEHYYKYQKSNLPNINEKIIPYPLVYDSNQLNWNLFLEDIVEINQCLKSAHRQNYQKVINIINSNFNKLKNDVNVFIRNTTAIFNKIDDDLNKLDKISTKNKSLSYNVKLRDDIYRSIVNYESIIDISNKIDIIQLDISKENEILVQNYKNLGKFYHNTTR